ncbi:MAG: CAP domain-containing protein [Acidimicrobiales bacterium]
MTRRQALRASIAAVSVGFAALAALGPAKSALGASSPSPDWLAGLNEHRAEAGLAPVKERRTLSAGARAHARYLVENDALTQGEDLALPFASPAGDRAGRNGNVAVSRDPQHPEAAFVNAWMTSPFHALGMLRPRLSSVGFGLWSAPDGPGIRAAATLDILSGLRHRPDGGPELLRWPGEGSVVDLRAYPGGQSPDLLTACPGYRAPAGLPVLVAFAEPEPIAVAAISVDGAPVESCLVTADAYVNPNAEQERIGRALLAGDRAAAVTPRSPLPGGATVTVRLQSEHRALVWSFRTA